MTAFSLLMLTTLATPERQVSSEDLEYLARRALECRKACGPVSTYICLRHLGHGVHLKDILEETNIDNQGASIAELLALLRKHGVPAVLVKTDSANLNAVPPYSILLIGESHCVVFVGVEDEGKTVRYIEPTDGSLRSVPREAMRRDWAGEAIFIQKPELGWFQFYSLFGVGLTGVLTSWFAMRFTWSLRFIRAGASNP